MSDERAGIEMLRTLADELEKEGDMVARSEAIMRKFVGHYPGGINPDLDEAYRECLDLLREIDEL